MESLSNVQQVSPQYSNYPVQNQQNSVTPPVEQKKDGNKKLIGALVGLGAIAAAGVAIYKGKGTKLSDIKFDKGIASLADDSTKLFTGTVKDTLKNGDKIKLVYENGVLKQSYRHGTTNILKNFKVDKNGDKIVEIFDNFDPKKALQAGHKVNITENTKKAQEKAAKETQKKVAQEAQEKAAKEVQEKLAKEAQEKVAK